MANEHVSVLLYVVSGLALTVLSFLTYKLIAPLIGWKHEFSSSMPSEVLDLPKPGNYDISINRERFWLFKKGEGPEVEGQTLAHPLPQADFEVKDAYTDEEVPCKEKLLLVPIKKSTKVSIIVRRFRAPAAGNYVLSNLSSVRLLESDTIQVRKYVPSADPFPCIVGITFSGVVFLMGSIFGTLMLIGTV